MGETDTSQPLSETDPVPETGDDETGTTPGVFGGRWSRDNWALILLFMVLTVVGVAISTGEVASSLVSTSSDSSSPVAVPLYVYLYASLGALGYAFTKLMNNLEDYDEWGEIENLAEMGLRIPAAWILAAGIYLLLSFFLPASGSGGSGSGGGTGGARYVAGLSFLVGLYVNVAMKSLGSLADRLLGRPKAVDETETPTDGGSGSGTPESAAAESGGSSTGESGATDGK